MTAWLIQQVNTIPAEIWWLLVTTMLLSSVGFYRVIYFVSIGYGSSITAMALVTAALFRQNLNWLAVAQLLLLADYGLRLLLFLLGRALGSAAQPQTFLVVNVRDQEVSLGQRVLIWLSLSLVSVLMFSPGLFRAAAVAGAAGAAATLIGWIGLLLMCSGLVMESIADHQKSVAKTKNPQRFCDVGLYRFVRSPTYLGEMLFWLGNWAMGVPFYSSILRLALSLVGLVCLILIMLGSTKRMEESQYQRYSAQPAFQLYVRRVPLLLPFVPLYSLKKLRFYRGWRKRGVGASGPAIASQDAQFRDTTNAE